MAYIGKRPVDTFPANNAVTASIISANAVGSSEIANGAVGIAELATNAVTSAKLAQNSVLTKHIDDGQVTADQLSTDAVTTVKITDSNVTTAKIADDAVTLAKMAGLARGKIIVGDSSGNPSALALGSNGQVLKSDGTDLVFGSDDGLTTEEVQDIVGGMVSSNTETGITVTYEDGDGTLDFAIGTLNQDTTGNAATASALETARAIAVAGDVTGTANFDGSAGISITTTLATDAIVAANITDANVTTAKLATDAVTTAKITDANVTTAKIANNAITSAKIPDGSIGATQLASTAVTAGNYGSSSAIPVITVDADGRITAASTAATSSTLTIAADSGSNDTVTVGTDTLTFAGTSNEVNTTVSDNQIQIGLPDNVTIGGNLTVTGNYTVNGTTTTVATSNMVVSDNLIELNNGASSNSNDSGIVIERGSTGDNAIFVWDESADKFVVGTTTATGASTGDLTITTGTLVGNIEGNVTGNVSGTAATVTTAAQTNITSLGTLTALTVDNVVIDGAVIGHTGDTDLITLSSGVVTVAGELDAVSLDISGNADIDGTLEADAITIGGVTLAETISDTVGAMVSSNTESGIAVTYDDSDNTLDFTVGTLNQNTTGSAATLTTARAIAVAGDVTGTANFDGSAAISITTALAANTVDSAELVDGSIDTSHIADDQITQAKIADDAVGADQLAANSVVSASIVNGSIVAADLADNSVTSAKIVNGTIVAADIANNAILTQHIDDNQITGDQLADDLVLSGTGAIRMPDGTTAQRPGSAAAGMFRYNTTTSKFEGYTDSWGDIGGGGSNTFARQSFTGDGSTTGFTLSQSPDSENNLIVFIEGVFQDQDAYSVSGTTLTFGTAPVNGRGIIVYHVKSAVSGTNLSHNQFNGDGSAYQFTLSITPVHENNTMVYIDGVYQNKTSYSISGTTLDFGSSFPPPNGSKVECMTMNQLDINVPVDDTISTAKLQSSAVTEAKIAVNAVTSLKIAENAITARELATNAIATLYIADNSVTSVKIAQNSILTKHIDDDQIVTSHILDSNVTTAKIADNAVTAAKIGADVLTDQVAGITSAATPGSNAITIDSNEHTTVVNNLIVNALTGVNRTTVNSAVGLSVNSDAASTSSYSIEACNNSGNTRFIVDGVGNSRFFGSDNSETARFSSDGNVGIGTTSPAVKGEIKNAASGAVATSGTTQTNGVLRLSSSATTGIIDFGMNGSNPFIQATDSTGLNNFYNLNLNPAGGNVGIGTASPDNTLHVDASGGGTIKLTREATSTANFLRLECDGTNGNIATIFNNGDAERMRIDASGDVRIGTSTSAYGFAEKLIVGDANDNDGITIQSGTTHQGNVAFNDGGTTAKGRISYQQSTNFFEFLVNNAVRLKIDTNGRQAYNGSGTINAHATFVGEVGSGFKALAFERTVGGGEVGTIVANASSTTYNTSSDYRLKENVDYTWDATTRLKQLKPARFNWIVDETNTLVDGFLAHEVSSIVPEAISGEKDAMGEALLYEHGDEIPEGKSVGDVKKASAPEYQGIDHSKLVPLLVKTIQELEARIETLEG